MRQRAISRSLRNVASGLVYRWHTSAVMNPLARREARDERGGHPADQLHEPHLVAAIDWLERAQDAGQGGGLARGFSLAWNPYFRSRGWQPPYPETTGYTIPTLYGAAHALRRPELARRAERAAAWEVEIQLESGAVRGGVLGQPVSPSVFNTGQVIFGWLAAFQASERAEFAEAARRAAGWLRDVLEPDGVWRSGNSRFARSDATLYNTRVAWALAEAGTALEDDSFSEAARRNLEAAAARQHANGWLPDCCLTDPGEPLLHTIAYTIRGLVEGGRVLRDERLLEAGGRAARAVAAAVREDGWIAGRHTSAWDPASTWSCLTGNAQMANNWLRLHAITGDPAWVEPVPRVLEFLKRTQNRESRSAGLRGGIKGSFPVDGWYGRYEVLNWATKYFADALMRDADRTGGRASSLPAVHLLA